MPRPKGDQESAGCSGGRTAVGLAGATYVFENLLLHAARAGSQELWRRLIERLEQEEFLARQAELPNGFETVARQLERWVLPAVVELGDWGRFYRYLLTAANLRALADSLDDPLILQALARSGRLPLAEAVVARLPRAVDRARGFGVLAGVLSPAEPAFGRLTTALSGELETLGRAPEVGNEEEARRWCRALTTIGRLLAPNLRALWRGWIACLSPWKDLADEVRLSVAEGFIDAGELDAPELWEVLAQVDSEERLLRRLPRRLAEAGCCDLRRWLGLVRRRLPQSEAAPQLPWSVGLALVARSGGDPVAEWSVLQHELAPPRWDPDLLEIGAELWHSLPDDALRNLASELGTVELDALLHVLVLEGRRDRESFEAALASLQAVCDDTRRTSLYLRALAVAPPESASMVLGCVRQVLARLAAIQYAVPVTDLRVALDLAARYLPRYLRRCVNAALAAPESGPGILRALAEYSQEEGLLEELFLRAETYAAMAATNAAEGFELRGEILVLLACRLVQRRRDLDTLGAAAERLLPDEEDRLRAAAARALGSGAAGLTEALCAGIQDRRLQLQVRLATLPDGSDPGDLVSPSALYGAAARMEPVEDELRALGALLPEPRDPARLADEHLEGVRSVGRRVEALADLALHSLRYQVRRFRPERQDRLAAVLPLKEALGVVESDDWLVSLTPELVTIGGHLGPRQAVAEIQEAFDRVAELEGVSWERREEILIDLVTRIETLLLDGEPGSPLGHVPEPVRRRHARRLLAWLARLPARARDSAAGDVLRRRWHRFLPCVTAITDGLDPRSRPGRLGSRGADRVRLPLELLLRASADHGPDWAGGHEGVFHLCSASAEDRVERADRIVAGGERDLEPDVPRALAWLLLRDAPDRVSPVLARIDAGPCRNQIALELLRTGLPPDDVARDLVSLLSSEGGAREWGRTWVGLRNHPATPESGWLAAVADLVARGRLDPGDPRTAPVRRRLWELTPDEGLPDLARAALRGLATGGRSAGERAARLFLHAYIQPRPGERAPGESWRRHAEMWRALDGARSLDQARTKAALGPGESLSDALAPSRQTAFR